MATVNYTTLLGLALPTTGDLSGQWGNEVNEYISKYVDASVAGTQTISGSQTAVTLSPTNGSALSQAGSGATGSSQYAVINCTGNPASTLTITVTYSSLTNAQFSKTYAVINATSTSQSVVVRATTSSGTSSGVTVASGERCLITWNGSNFVKVASTVALPAGSTTQVQYNNAGALAGSSNFVFDGTNVGIGTSSPTGGRLHVTQVSGSAIFGTTAGGTGYGGSFQNTDGGTTKFFRAAGAGGNGVFAAGVDSTTQLLLDTSGNLGLGVTPSVWSQGKAFEISAVGEGLWGNGLGDIWMMNGAYFNAGWKYSGTTRATAYRQGAGTTDGSHSWHIAASGTAGNAISFTQAMTLDAGGRLLLGVTSAAGNAGFQLKGASSGYVRVEGTSSTMFAGDAPQLISGAAAQDSAVRAEAALLFAAGGATERARITAGGQFAVSSAGTAGAPVISKSDDLDTGIFFPAANELAFAVNGVEELRITSAGFTRPVAYADTVSALGNTGTATTINLQNANVFTATLTGNCTFTLSNAIASGSSSFTLILTNDGTAGRTVAWSGGSFVFPGGAAALSRTTTANAVDVWVFFTPNGGTTWYGNIAMKDMKA